MFTPITVHGDSKMTQLNQNYTLSSSLMTQSIDDEILLMDMQTQNFYALNNSGEILFEILQKHTILQNVYDEMFETFEVEKDQLLNDIETFVENLTKQNMMFFK